MTFAVAAGYGIAIWVAAAALIHLSSVARPPVVARSSARHMPEAEPFRLNRTLGRKEIR